MKKVTIGDVAQRAEVSVGTVSAVLNEKNTVKPETRKIVLDIMKELNYRPYGSARNLKMRTHIQTTFVYLFASWTTRIILRLLWE